ncbi:MAG: (d)CMP kinase [Dehalococcoidia bacterium]|nr:(d)CMP kinase [Dehalococcoidia bacterium]
MTNKTLPFSVTIAVDGPSATGKSVVGLAIATRLGYLYLDTGAMYRAMTWLALKKGVAPDDAEGLTNMAENHPIEISRPSVDDGRQYTVMIDGEDVTWAIRQPDVEANVSLVSAVPGVRLALVVQQRRIGRNGRVVMVGRDIGTVVMPDADLKIFLTASAGVRARRRGDELMARGQPADLETILLALMRRDKLDSERADSPLKPAVDAVIVDTDRLSINEVVEQIMALAEGCR